MKRSVISSMVFSAAMLLSTAAWSQTMIAGKAVSGEELKKVQTVCEDLSVRQQASQDTGVQNPGTATEAAGGAAVKDLGMSEAGGVDLAKLTLDDCIKAGIIPQ